MIAVDASVAVKWLWPEPGHVEARQLLKDGTRLVAPALIRLEVAGAVLRQYRQKLLSEAEAHSVLGFWSRMLEHGIVRLVPNEEIYDLAIAVAFLARHPLADCLYVAVGRDLDIPLITADEILYKRCIGVYKKVRLLAVATPH